VYPLALEALLHAKELAVGDAIHLLDMAEHDAPRLQRVDDAPRLLEGRLGAEHRVRLADQPLPGEEVELADPHREHCEIAPAHVGRRLPAEELVHRNEEPAVALGQLERVHVALREPERPHGDTTDLDRLAVAQLVDANPASVAHELEVRHPAEPDTEV